MFSREDGAASVVRELQCRIAMNDEKAFRQVFNIFSSRLVDFSFAMIKNHPVAQELVDDVFIRVWKNRADIGKIENLRVYLYSAIKNASLSFLSKKANDLLTKPFDFIDIQLHDQLDPEKAFIHKELFESVNAAVENLPPRCKIIFKLVRQDGLKYREVAEVLNISENTVDAQMVIAVRRIAEAIRTVSPRSPCAQKNSAML